MDACNRGAGLVCSFGSVLGWWPAPPHNTPHSFCYQQSHHTRLPHEQMTPRLHPSYVAPPTAPRPPHSTHHSLVLQLRELYEAIKLGANSFLTSEYKMCTIFVVVVAPLIALLLQNGTFSAVAFVVGALTSMISGWIGMCVDRPICPMLASPNASAGYQLPDAFAGFEPSFSHTPPPQACRRLLECALHCWRLQARPSRLDGVIQYRFVR